MLVRECAMAANRPSQARSGGARGEESPPKKKSQSRPVTRATGRPNVSVGLKALTTEIVECRACPRLVQWREDVAVEKRASFRDETYWGRPVPGFGDRAAQLLVLGLAPAAHGANRTGRVFTGDRSGDWLFRAMHKTGFANQPLSTAIDDGLVLQNAYVAAAVRCAPPDNAPLPEERDRCLPFLQRELSLLTNLRVIIVLGQFAYDVMCRELQIRPKPKFSHGAIVKIPPHTQTNATVMLCSFHPSQQNTFTGRLTERMLDAVFLLASETCANGSLPIQQ
jgi:uracil-DNA glycosylase